MTLNCFSARSVTSLIWWDWHLSEDEKKETELVFTGKVGK